MRKLLRCFFADESGQDIVEYTLIGVLLAMGTVVASSNLGAKLSSEFNHIGSFLN